MLENILSTTIADVKRTDVTTLVSMFEKYKSVNPVVDAVVLFGSAVTQDCTDESDLDIVIIGKGVRKNIEKFSVMLTEFYRYVDTEVDILYADSVTEIQEMSHKHPVYIDVLKEGKIIWQDNQSIRK
jgi:predicted nucleotidyltransferase